MKRIKFIRRNKYHQMYSLFECDCGRQFITRDSAIKFGTTKSCGCLNKLAQKRRGIESNAYKHGHRMNKTFSRTYRTWANMLSRCYNPNYKNFKYWGGKGIRVCEAWHDFKNFLVDMGIRPKGTSIDRINGDKDYYKENCRWATRQQQSENRSNVKQ